ncbi:hypothetical protein K7X08_028893 [Anisodus acutangulus]|uniref:Uncharacterized protein n=1 Tax=Anisodus acutangulus TaxID=402998 RepID=A0A9Q1QU66_9SOLA|nr:hypothetical protein K7X08_028893 [Anisodus acutangulus]
MLENRGTNLRNRKARNCSNSTAGKICLCVPRYFHVIQSCVSTLLLRFNDQACNEPWRVGMADIATLQGLKIVSFLLASVSDIEQCNDITGSIFPTEFCRVKRMRRMLKNQNVKLCFLARASSQAPFTR